MKLLTNNSLTALIRIVKTALKGKADSVHTHTEYLNRTNEEVYTNNLLLKASNTSNIAPSSRSLAASPFARDFWHNRLAFLDDITITEHKVMANDGTWVDSTVNISPLFAQKESNNITLLGTNILARTFTLYSAAFPYCGIDWFEIGVAYSNPFSNFEAKIEVADSNKTQWDELSKSVVSTNSAPIFFYSPSYFSNFKYIRFTFTKTSNQTTGTVNINSIKGFTTRKGDQGRGIEQEFPYNWNDSRDIFPHSDNQRILGSSSKRWLHVYASDFVGHLEGNADTATNASKVNNHTVDTDVPANAKFTDTTYGVATTSTNGLMSSGDKGKLDGIAVGANKTVVDSSLSGTSTNPVQNKIVTNELSKKINLNIQDTRPTSNGIWFNTSGTGGDTSVLNLMLDMIYPVGSIYMNVSNVEPNALLGGVWERIAQGRTLFGEGSLNGITYNGGQLVEAGLPNITGELKRVYGEANLNDSTGAFHKLNSGAFKSGNSNVWEQNYGWGFDASRSNSIYGKSTTVQPNALVVYIWKRTA